ncbi:MAG: globin [Pseudomonadales bacterium]
MNQSTQTRATQLFEESYTRVFGTGIGITPTGEAFFRRFYQRFFAASPRVPELFRQTDMNRQVQMLKKSLYQVVALYITDTIPDHVRKIAERHHALKIETELYDIWLDCLIETVKEFDDPFDFTTELAWRLALAPAITYMKFWAGSESAPQQGP